MWPQFKIFKLVTNMRSLPEEVNFSEFLLKLGRGDFNDSNDCIKLPQRCVANASNIHRGILEETFGDLIKSNMIV